MRVAIVVQRYGSEILAGAERHAREVATRLSTWAKVDVLTSCAEDHLTWKNVFPSGISSDGKVQVHRFRIEAEKNLRKFNALSKPLFLRFRIPLAEEYWLKEQGPYVPSLLEHIKQHASEYDAFLFFTYLYWPTVKGLPLVARKALLIPTAHDEPPMRFGIYRPVFDLPRKLLVNSPEEQQLIQKYFPKAAVTRVVGLGMNVPKASAARFSEQFNISKPYLLYVGRQEEGKGLPQLLQFHQQLVRRFHDAPWLILAGSGSWKAKGERVRQLGALSEQEKFDAYKGALACVVPSEHESFSIGAIEAMAVGTPALVNRNSAVLRGHVDRSDAGVSYNSVNSFCDGVRYIGNERSSIAKKAKIYAKQFSWAVVLKALKEEISAIAVRGY